LLNHVLGGKRYISPGISKKVIEAYPDGKKTIKFQTSLAFSQDRAAEASDRRTSAACWAQNTVFRFTKYGL
jgi:hypothetical protein